MVFDTSVVDDFVHSWDTEGSVDYSVGDIPWGVNNCFLYFRLTSLYDSYIGLAITAPQFSATKQDI
jgi:hypothetical protein